MKLIFVPFCILFLVSCSGYNKVLKGDDYQKKFETANQLFDKGQELRSVALFEQVYQRLPKTAQGEISYYRLGKAFYAEKDWYQASYYLSNFPVKFPYSTRAEEATFLAALCSVQNSPEPSLDQQETELALNELQLFVGKYPESARIDTCNQVMDKLRYKLETKDVLNIRLYSKTENYRAATVSAEQFMDNYPRSPYREEMGAILLRNSYELTVNSIESKIADRIEKTKERYRNFVAEFPESKYLREFDNYSERLDALVATQKN